MIDLTMNQKIVKTKWVSYNDYSLAKNASNYIKRNHQDLIDIDETIGRIVHLDLGAYAVKTPDLDPSRK